MSTVVIAEAGLSECARYDVCGSDLGIWLAMWGAAWVLGALWLAVVLYATFDVLTADVGAGPTVLWLLVVWLLPLLGAIAWFRHVAVHGSPARKCPNGDKNSTDTPGENGESSSPSGCTLRDHPTEPRSDRPW